MKGRPYGITAEHLLDIEALELPLEPAGEERRLDLAGLSHGLTAMIPSQAIIFGTCHIPKEYSQNVLRFHLDLAEKDDPNTALRGKRRFVRRSDILFLEFLRDAPLPPAHWLPRVSPRLPEPGEWICAVGFPDIEVYSSAQSMVLVREEGMAVSFARVTQVVRDGRGHYERSPIAFVESDWPGGMSGGPVFNSSGRVVGVVSREAAALDLAPTRGSFTLLAPVTSSA